MIKLAEVTQKDLDDVDARLEQAMQRLTDTALEVKKERDKYAAALYRTKRELQEIIDIMASGSTGRRRFSVKLGMIVHNIEMALKD